jgi:hypothetical protein
MSDLPKPGGIPDNRMEKPSDKRGGKEYINPSNRNDRARVMPADPDSRHPEQRRPCVIDQNGSYHDVNGNPTRAHKPGTTAAAHIPYELFKFRR